MVSRRFARIVRFATVLTSALVVLAGAACTSEDPPQQTDGSLPEASALLRDAATATGDIRSAHFTLAVNGTIDGIDVHGAEGDLTREGGPSGGAKGTVRMTLLGNLFEGEFVLVDDQAYIKGPTGGFQRLPAALIANTYDPSAILDPQRGIAKVLAAVQDARTEAEEEVDGVPAYRVSGRVTKDVVGSLVPGVKSDVELTVWLRQDSKQPIKATVRMPGKDGPATVDLTLSDVDKPVTITAPA